MRLSLDDEPGLWMELIHPELDNGRGGNWLPSAGSQPIFGTGGQWWFFKGTEEPSGTLTLPASGLTETPAVMAKWIFKTLSKLTHNLGLDG